MLNLCSKNIHNIKIYKIVRFKRSAIIIIIIVKTHYCCVSNNNKRSTKSFISLEFFWERKDLNTLKNSNLII